MQLFNETSALSSYDASSREEQQESKLYTAKQWLANFRRYPRRGEVGQEKRKKAYFSYEQTQLVRSEVDYHPFPDVLPIPDKHRGKTFYYDDDCEIKLINKHWLERHNRDVREGAVPCEERQGFDPETKTILYMNFFLFADTYPVS